MAFPSTNILDNFNRANTQPPGGDWATTQIQGSTDVLKIVSNQCAATVSNGANGYLNTTYGPDQEAYVTVATRPGNGAYVAFFLRIQNPGTSSWSGYALVWLAGSGNDSYLVRRYANGSFTSLVSPDSPALVAGEKIGMSITGTTIAVWKTVGGVWQQVGANFTDTTITAAGKIGMELGDTTVRVDDLGGGTAGSGGATDAAVTAVPMTATGALPVPSVDGGNSATVIAVPMTASGALAVPTVTGARNATVTAVPMAATGALGISDSLSSQVEAAPMGATGSLPAPRVDNGAPVALTVWLPVSLTLHDPGLTAATKARLLAAVARQRTVTAAMHDPALAATTRPRTLTAVTKQRAPALTLNPQTIEVARNG